MKYLQIKTLPKSIPSGKILAHNFPPEAKDTKIGWRGFRVWSDDPNSKKYVVCKCGWANLKHYQPKATAYKMKPYQPKDKV